MADIKTLSEFIVERQSEFPGSSGDLSSLLTAFRLAGKIMNREVNKAGLMADILGAQGTENVQGEQQQKLDVYANNLFLRMMKTQGAVCAVASEEDDDIVHFDNGGKYVVTMDPLDGSSNIDVNVSIGTIFSIYKRISTGPKATLEDFLQPGNQPVERILTEKQTADLRPHQQQVAIRRSGSIEQHGGRHAKAFGDRPVPAQ